MQGQSTLGQAAVLQIVQDLKVRVSVAVRYSSCTYLANDGQIKCTIFVRGIGACK